MNKLVIFDLDGTLLDTPRSIVETITATFAAMQFEKCSFDEMRATIGLPLEIAFSTLTNLRSNHDLITSAVKKYQTLYKEMILPKAKELLFPNVESSLRYLRDNNYKLAIITNKIYQSAVSILSSSEILHYFDVVVGADLVAHRKPHPEAANRVLNKLGVLSENTVMVGDTHHDILMAKNAGIQSIAVTYGIDAKKDLALSHPTWIVDNFSEVLKIIVEHNA